MDFGREDGAWWSWGGVGVGLGVVDAHTERESLQLHIIFCSGEPSLVCGSLTGPIPRGDD